MGELTPDGLQVESGKSTPQSPMGPPSNVLIEAHRSATQSSPRRQTRNDTIGNLPRWLIRNQTGIAFNIIVIVFLLHTCISEVRPRTSKFFSLSYYNPRTGKYGAGFDDLYFIAFCIVLLTGLRAGVMEYILAPIARVGGLLKSKEVTRFSEQAWLTTWCFVVWPSGMFIYLNSPYYLNMAELWSHWPQRELDGLMKVYMMAQWSFWIQQLLVIHIEERRKDHWQMLTHHFVTITLVSTCYAYHQTKVGHLILVMMDTIDLTFPLAKCLKYLGYSAICDVLFGLFFVSWVTCRHVFYLMTCWSIYVDLPQLTRSGCYSGNMDNLKGPLPIPDDWSHIFEPFRNSEGMVCWNGNVTYFFLFCLLVLQVITIAWFALIVRVAMRVLSGTAVEDVRSEDEAESEEVEHEEPQPFEEEVGVGDIDLKGWERRPGGQSRGRSSGVLLSGSSARKELLNRIGCEQQID